MSMRKKSANKIRAREVRRLKQELRVLRAVCKGLFHDQQQCVSTQNLYERYELALTELTVKGRACLVNSCTQHRDTNS